ncbi:MAG: hypothetical protein HOJ57_34470 [Lentisphaerae bacterium]|jgi:hypothetical protein|nr:hypothetical protein [Lentisphaerota bacterium]MBT4820662.1 hypothetical protein [Lentisphaerota bacterium]MBT5611095.1 hypothetical protein [Lentisphaerota bacterium]MBT7055637.1 hypothetical protein [Lentisphaerota bacterium]
MQAKTAQRLLHGNAAVTEGEPNPDQELWVASSHETDPLRCILLPAAAGKWQEARTVKPADAIRLPMGKGWSLIAETAPLRQRLSPVVSSMATIELGTGWPAELYAQRYPTLLPRNESRGRQRIRLRVARPLRIPG